MAKSKILPLNITFESLPNKRTICPPSFPRFPELYLSLLENQDKINPEFIGKEFVSTLSSNGNNNGRNSKYLSELPEVVFDEDDDEIFESSNVKSSNEVRKEGFRQEKKPTDEGLDRRPMASKSLKEILKESRENSEKGKGGKKGEKEDVGERSSNRLHADEDDNDDNHNENDNENDNEGEHFTLEEPDDDPLSAYLKKDRSIGSRKNSPTKEKVDRFQETKNEILRDERKAPPSLKDIEDGGAFDTGGIKNMANVSRKDQEQEQKLREYLHKYTMLKRAYPTEEIPNFTINSDPDHVIKTYDNILRNLTVTDNITKYKKYLMFGFMGVEALGNNILGFDMKGFTTQQVLEMSSYEKLLIELGEKNRTPKSNLPVELRLLGMILMNAAFFVISKMAMKSMGTDILGSMNKAADAGVNASKVNQRKKQAMSGPDINLDDIPTASSDVKFV